MLIKGLFVDDTRVALYIRPARGVAYDDSIFNIGGGLAAVVDINPELVALDVETEILLSGPLELDVLDEIVRRSVQCDVDFRRSLAYIVLDIAIAFVAAGILIVAVLDGKGYLLV